MIHKFYTNITKCSICKKNLKIIKIGNINFYNIPKKCIPHFKKHLIKTKKYKNYK